MHGVWSLQDQMEKTRMVCTLSVQRYSAVGRRLRVLNPVLPLADLVITPLWAQLTPGLVYGPEIFSS